MSKTVLVTGATGFIGHHICNRLYNENYTVIGIGTSGENRPKCQEFFHLTLDGIPWEDLPQIDICFHQAANNDTTDMDLDNMLRSNYFAPMDLFTRLFSRYGCKKFVYASSCSVYGNQPVPYKEHFTKLDPLNPYAISKMKFDDFAEKFIFKTGANVIGLRYTNVYGTDEGHKGKRASMIYQLLQKMLAGERPKIFKFGQQLRDWVYIEDILDLNMLCSQIEWSGVFNAGSGLAVSFNEIVEIINEELGTSLEPEYIDCPFESAYQTHTQVDMSLTTAELGFTPKYDVRAGIKKLIEEIKKAKI